MDAWPFIAIAFGIGLVLAVIARRRDGKVLHRVRRLTGVGATGDPEFGIARLQERIGQLERDLAGARRDHELVVDLLEIGVVDLDPRLRVVSANAAAHALVDRAPGTLLGLDALEAFLDTQVETVARTALTEGAAARELQLRGIDGRVVLVRANRSTAGGVWLVLADVTELRRLQQIRAEFIDNLSHELRTPLTTVSLLAETLTREAQAVGSMLPAKMRDRIERIEIETGHLVQMVTEIMDLSRIESGAGLGLVEEVDLGRLARSSTDRLRLFAERQGVTLAVDAEPGLPPIRGDEARLGQVFVNLLHNAVKFSPDGGEVHVTVRRSDDELVTDVSDRGIGIPRAAQARIFERFYKVDRARARNQAGGTGLGLAIARHVVEQHGGRIWVESGEGVGSTFSFALPIGREDG